MFTQYSVLLVYFTKLRLHGLLSIDQTHSNTFHRIIMNIGSTWTNIPCNQSIRIHLNSCAVSCGSFNFDVHLTFLANSSPNLSITVMQQLILHKMVLKCSKIILVLTDDYHSPFLRFRRVEGNCLHLRFASAAGFFWVFTPMKGTNLSFNLVVLWVLGTKDIKRNKPILPGW